MKLNLKKSGAGMMVAILSISVLLSACGNSSQEFLKTEDNQTKKMGRYREERYEGNEEFTKILHFTQLEDGTLALFDQQNGYYSSKDRGKNWEKKEIKQLEERRYSSYIGAAAIAPDGGLVYCYSPYTEGENEDLYYQYAYASPDGVETELNLEEADSKAPRFWFSPEGVLYVASNDCVLYRFDKDNATLTKVLQADNRINLVSFLESTIIIFTSNTSYIYDMETKELKEDDKILNGFLKDTIGDGFLEHPSGGYSVLACGTTQDTLYLASNNGIFRHSVGGGTMEQLMEGTLYSLGDPSKPFYGMILLENQEFLILKGNVVSYFFYDETMPTIPEKTLYVFSMEKDEIMQRAVSVFQEENPEVYVKYEIGISGENGPTKEECLKSLNTEMMAGKGPDVLNLIDLPLTSYVEKGMLADLNEVISEATKEEQFFEQILHTYEEKGSVQMVPVAFQIPVIMGKGEQISQIKDLNTLVAEVKKVRKEKNEGTIMYACTADYVLKLLSLSCAPSWTLENGEVAEDQVKEFLIAAKEIWKLEQEGLSEEDIKNYESELNMRSSFSDNSDDPLLQSYFQGLQNYANPGMISIGKLNSADTEFNALCSMQKMSKEFRFQTFSGQAEKIYYPTLIAGVSSQSKETELSKKFVKTLLSARVLEKSQYSFPVNKNALESQLTLHGKITKEGEHEEYGQVSASTDDKVISVNLYLPNEKDYEWIMSTFLELKVPYIREGMVETAILESGKKVLEENMEIEDAIQEIKKKVSLLLAE